MHKQSTPGTIDADETRPAPVIVTSATPVGGGEVDESDADEVELDSAGAALARLDLGPAHLGLALTLGAVLLYFNSLALWPTDVWSHIAYGRWILEHRALPQSEPFLVLARNAFVTPYCWLGQVLLALVERAGGARWLSNLFALVTVLRFGIIAATLRRRAGRLGLALAATIFLIAATWGKIVVIRPEMFAVLCFDMLLFTLAAVDAANGAGGATLVPGEKPRTPRWPWLAVPLIFAAWVNLHASMYVGLAILGTLGIGRAIDICRGRTNPIGLASAIAADREFHTWCGLTLAAVTACCIHPSGWNIFPQTLAITRIPNLRVVTEWEPLALATLPGDAFLLSFALAAAVLRLGRRPVRSAEVLLLALFAWQTTRGARFFVWYFGIFAWLLLPHAADALARLWPPQGKVRPADARARRSLVVGIASVLVLFAAFNFSYVGDSVLGLRPRSDKSLYAANTPLALAAWLVAHPPAGQMWNSQVLGDWLMWTYVNQKPLALPLNVFMNSQVHLVPPQLFHDYTNIGFMVRGWRGLLNKYRVRTVVVSKKQHPTLAAEIREQAGWRVDYEDAVGVVATRIGDIPVVPATVGPPAPGAEEAGGREPVGAVPLAP